MTTYKDLYNLSLSNPEKFWGEAASAIDWIKPWTTCIDYNSHPVPRWFSGGELNTCYNAVDRHVIAGHGKRPALIHDSAYSGSVQHLSYEDLQNQVCRMANILTHLGVSKGDRVLIYMPMIPEAVVTMLATVRLGAIHSVIFGGFAAPEVTSRIDDAKPDIIVAASCGIEPGRIVPYMPLVNDAINMATHKPSHCLVFQREAHQADLVEGRDIDAFAAMDATDPEGASCIPVAATDPCYILYTSGSTGKPKGIVRDTAGHMVALTWSLKHIFGIHSGDVFWTASDIGWVVGHSYIVYAPLLSGCTTVMFEGKPVGTPDASAFWRIIEKHRVKCLFTAPTALRAIKREDSKGELCRQHNLSSLETLFLAGERSDTNTVNWAGNLLNVPVIDHWWQTETGWPITAVPQGIDTTNIKIGTAGLPMPGWRLDCLDDHGVPMEAGKLGSLVAKLPLPPGALPTYWNNDARFIEGCLTRYPNYYETGDAGLIDADGYVSVMARTDDIINVAGHRLSTGGMEEIICSHPDIAECAVIGIADALKGHIPCGFVVLKSGVVRQEEDIVADIVSMIRKTIGPVAAFKRAVVVARLPKTRSGKILRRVMRQIADEKTWTVPPTIDDPNILNEISKAFHNT